VGNFGSLPGVTRVRTIRLADEIHTPDSSRGWRADTYPQRLATGEPPDSFRKDAIRAWGAARCDPEKDDIPEICPELIWKTALT
jgi:phosphoribosylaminoimidazole-succinocarboxamide synthase